MEEIKRDRTFSVEDNDIDFSYDEIEKTQDSLEDTKDYTELLCDILKKEGENDE